MSRLRAFALAAFAFFVGDDWRVALGVVVALAATAAVASLRIAAWWVMPVAVPLLLWLSVRRFARR